jgi:membrane associated rhomboid family serine protease
MNEQSIWRPIALATAVAGALDILFAMILTLIFGREIGDMLRGVASGPFPGATDMGTGGAILGLLVHFTLMGIMATIYVLVARRIPDMLRSPIKWGVIYGLITYVAMNLIVIPLRFHPPFPPKTLSIVTQLFAHIVLVGLPFALITARSLRGSLSGLRATA